MSDKKSSSGTDCGCLTLIVLAFLVFKGCQMADDVAAIRKEVAPEQQTKEAAK